MRLRAVRRVAETVTTGFYILNHHNLDVTDLITGLSTTKGRFVRRIVRYRYYCGHIIIYLQLFFYIDINKKLNYNFN